MRRRLAALSAVAVLAAGAAPAPAPFRVAVAAAAGAPCAPVERSAPAGEQAYFALLQKRLERPVLACPVASRTEAGTALAAGRVDLAVLDEAAYAPVRASVRATLSVRPEGGLTRVPVVLAVRGREGVASGQPRRMAFAGSTPIGLQLPREVLAEQGLGAGVVAEEVIASDEAAALAALRSGKVDAAVLQVGAWQRECRGDTPKAQPCADLRIVWRARPKAPLALAVRRDLPDPDRYRLIGVHMAMHLEDRPAFAWAAAQLAPNGADFEPAEAEALTAARLK